MDDSERHLAPPAATTPPSPEFVIALAEIEAGDLVFVRRDGFIQWLVDWAGDRWRHVGIALPINGHWWVLEAGRAGYRARPIRTVLGSYSSIAVSRLQPCPNDCAGRLVEAALAMMDTPTTYPGNVELGVAGLLSLARRRPRVNQGAVGAIVRSVARRHQARAGHGLERTLCASLVVRSLAEVCAGHARFPNMASEKDRATGQRPDPMAERLALPDDIWRLFETDNQYSLHEPQVLDSVPR